MGVTLDSNEYTNLSDDTKVFLNQLGDTISNTTLQSYNSAEQINRSVQEIVAAFNSLSEVDQKNLDKYITLTTEWNNDEMSYSQYIKKINELNDLLNNLFPGNENEELRKSILLLFDVADVEDLDNQVDTIINRQKRVLNEKYKGQEIAPIEQQSAPRQTSGQDILNQKKAEQNQYGIPLTSNISPERREKAEKLFEDWLNQKIEDSEFSYNDLELLSNLSEEDIILTYDFESPEDLDEWFEKIQKYADENEIDITFSSNAVKNLDALKDAWSGLDEVFDTTVTYGAKATVDDLQSLIDGLGGVTFNFKDDELDDANVMSNAIEAYTDELIKNGKTAEDAREATNQLATAYIDQSDILKDLEEDNTDYYIAVLKSMGVTNAEEVVMSRLGKVAKKTSTNLKALSKVVAQNRKVLEDGLEDMENGEETSAEFNKAITAISDELATLLLVEEDALDADFIKEHLDKVIAAVEGDLDALDELRLEAAKEISINLGVNDDEIFARFGEIQALINGLDDSTLTIGGEFDNSDIIAKFDEILATGEYTMEEFSKIINTLSGGAITADLKYRYITDATKLGNGAPSDVKNVVNKRVLESASYKWNGKGTGAKVTYNGVDDDDSDSSSSDSDSDSDTFSESFDWIETAISRLEEELDRLDEQVGNTYKNWTSRNEALLEQITKTGDEIKMQADASKKYEELANEVNIPETYKIKVQAGEMDVEEIDASDVTEELKEYYNNLLDQGIGDQEWLDKYKTNKLTDEDYATLAGIDKDDLTDAIKDYWNDQLSKGNGTAEMLAKYNTNTLTDSDYAEMLSTYIQDYEDLYDKSKEATDKETELTKTVLDYHKQIFEDIQTQLDEIVTEVEDKVNLINERITRSEEMGYFVNTDYYDQLLALTKEENDARAYQIEQAQQAMNEAVANGMEIYSEEWYEMYHNLNEMVKEQEEGLTEEVKIENDKRQQLWDRADWIEEQADKVYEEFSFLQEMLSGEKLYEDDGHITEYGKANMGLVSAEYEANREELARYQSQYEDLQKELEEAPGDKNLIERSNTLKENIQNITKSLLENKQAMKDILQTVVDNYLSNLQKIIDKYKDSLSAAKD